MSFLYFDKVSYRNFGPFADATLDLDYGGLTVIEGKMVGKKGCDSNGAGKSFLFDGIAWCLFGRCIRDKYKGDDVIKLDAKKDCFVSLILRAEDGDPEIAITRYRKDKIHKNNVVLVVNGKNESLGTNPATTARIEQLIGLNFTAFCNSVAFGVREDVKSFFTAPDSDRKETLERILNLGVYTKAGDVAKKHLDDILADIESQQHERIGYAVALKEQKELRAQVLSQDEADEAKLQLSLKRLELKKLKQRVAAQKIVVAEKTEKADAEAAVYEEAVAEYSKDKDTYDDLATTIQRDIRKHERLIGEATGDQKVVKAAQVKLAKLKGKKCPTCQQTLTAAKHQKLDAEYSLSIKSTQERIDALTEELDALKAQLAGLTEPEYPESPQAYVEAGKARSDAQFVLNELVSLVEVERGQIESMAKTQEGIDQKTTGLDAKIEKYEAKIAEIDAEIKDLHEQADALGFWVEAFSNQGLKSFLIEAELPQINQRATECAQLLLGEGATVRLSATSKLKTKDLTREKLDVEGSIPDCTESYAGASKGQRKRMDLSLLLAFRSIVADRQAKGIKQMFADELFDGMDKTGAETVTTLLRDISENCPVALVTHDERIKPVADRLVTVVHEKKTAILKV